MLKLKFPSGSTITFGPDRDGEELYRSSEFQGTLYVWLDDDEDELEVDITEISRAIKEDK